MADSKYKILYKMIYGDIYYVSDYTISELNGEKVLGGCRLTTELSFAKAIPNYIRKENILDKSICIMYTNELVRY